MPGGRRPPVMRRCKDTNSVEVSNFLGDLSPGKRSLSVSGCGATMTYG